MSLRFFTYFLAVFFLFVSWTEAGFATDDLKITGARFGGTPERTRFVADVSGVFQFKAVNEMNPDRVVVEIGDVGFDLPSGVGKKVRGLVKKFTYGIVSNGQSRLVLETDGPVRIAQSFMIDRKGKQPARLVLDLVRESAVDSPLAPEHNLQEDAAVLSPESNDATITRRKTIVIDAGHGGPDPGAVNARNTKEKDVVLAFALVLKKLLVARPDIQVVMTRESDVFLPLRERVAMARRHQADLLIAIHADIIRGRTARGTTLYTLSEQASDAEADALARKENNSDRVAGVKLPAESQEVSDVLIELLHRESKLLSMVFAKASAQQLAGVTQMTGKPIRSAGFTVLKAPDVPSVLIELGFLSSKEDEKLMTNAEWQRRTAEALAVAIDIYLEEAGSQQSIEANNALNSAVPSP